ncbi:ATP-dependent DNA helicase PIF1-like protein, partial [Tanacetum coccineum]
DDKEGLNYLSCKGEKCKKGNLDRKEGRFWCDSCNISVVYHVIRYRLELEIFDDTAEVVVVMFDETATSLLKCFVSSILDSEGQDEEEHSGLPPALANIVGTSHTLELKSHTYYKHRTYENFTCWKVVTGEKIKKNPIGGYSFKAREELDDSNAEESFVADSQTKKGDVGCSSDTRKRKRIVMDDSE